MKGSILVAIGLAIPLAVQAQAAAGDEPVATAREIPLPGQPGPNLVQQPWLDPSRDPDERAGLALARMTLDEKLQLLHGSGFVDVPLTSNGGAGFTPGIPRLGIPDLNLADSTLGVARGASRSRYSTLLPSAIAEAATWDPATAYEYAALVGRELRAQGYNVSLAGGVNLAREPRNGRTFEYRGEDPILAGVMAAQAVRGMQDQHVIADLKHFAFNDQETGRHSANVLIDYKAARESDLLAFEIAVREGRPGMVMCAYNRVWGVPACESEELLDRTLRRDWGFQGWVLSDWGATHSTERSILAGLDQEQPGSRYFGEPLREAVLAGRVPVAAVDTSVRRILRTMFAVGVVDHPPQRQVVDIAAGLRVAQAVEERGAVLLRNEGGLLPISAGVRTVAVIGGHADVGVLTGGGSGQVDPPGGNAVAGQRSETLITPDEIVFPEVWWPSPPLRALRAAAPGIRFTYDDGTDPARAAAAASAADMAVVFAYAHSAEHGDSPDLSLPGEQDALIEAVAGANPSTAVVLETGGPVTMPWINRVGAVVAAWYPGAAGGEAIASLLLGRVNFSGRLPISFPRSEADLPDPVIQGTDVPMVLDRDSIFPELGLRIRAPFDLHYDEGALVGYRWHQSTGRRPLFPFGHGLSYTSFAYSDLAVTSDGATFSVTNTGRRDGTEVAQVYLSLPERGRLAPRRLVGWARLSLEPGETRRVTVDFHPLGASTFDVTHRAWRRPSGRHRVDVGGSSEALPLSAEFSLP